MGLLRSKYSRGQALKSLFALISLGRMLRQLSGYTHAWIVMCIALSSALSNLLLIFIEKHLNQWLRRQEMLG